MPEKYICIHGHFYQPLRENPWLEVVESQDSAAPFHDWNARVAAECYAPNSAARMMNDRGKIIRIVNNYERISFNFGPTLLGWMEAELPGVYQALLEADARALERWGHGGALAQVYHHLIMPLATPRDKRTQIAWGLADFERRFGRRAEGIWLAETAVDLETLSFLADEGVKFTILSPFQATQARAKGARQWLDVEGGRVDPLRLYAVSLPGRGEITICFYHAELSKSVAFEGLLNDGGVFASRLKSGLDPGRKGAQGLCLATDGESYGHHHRFGEMALAYALEQLDKDKEVTLTNLPAWLEKDPERWEARVRDNSSWSCAHGVERWRSDCGCALDPGRGWNQSWRGPLRDAFNLVKQKLDWLFQKEGARFFQDPWAARDAYEALVYDDSHENREDFLHLHAGRELDPEEAAQAWRLLESQRWGMAMFTSCGWFFDDLGGIEPVQNMRFAARAMQLVEPFIGQEWEGEVLKVLAEARSNQPSLGNGADIWRKQVAPARVGLDRVIAHAAISGVLGSEDLPRELYCYALEDAGAEHRHHLGMNLSWGRVRVRHKRLGKIHDLVYGALNPGDIEFKAWVAPVSLAGDVEELAREVEEPLRLLDAMALENILDGHFPGRRYALADLFLEGRRSLALQAVQHTSRQYADTARNLYESHRELMQFMRRISVPLPPVFVALAETLLAEDLIRITDEEAGAPPAGRLGAIARQARNLGLNMNRHSLRLSLETRLAQELEALAENPRAQAPVEWVHVLLDVCRAIEVRPEMWDAQNIFHALATSLGGDLPMGLQDVGGRLGFDLEVLK